MGCVWCDFLNYIDGCVESGLCVDRFRGWSCRFLWLWLICCDLLCLLYFVYYGFIWVNGMMFKGDLKKIWLFLVVCFYSVK